MGVGWKLPCGARLEKDRFNIFSTPNYVGSL